MKKRSELHLYLTCCCLVILALLLKFSPSVFMFSSGYQPFPFAVYLQRPAIGKVSEVTGLFCLSVLIKEAG